MARSGTFNRKHPRNADGTFKRKAGGRARRKRSVSRRRRR